MGAPATCLRAALAAPVAPGTERTKCAVHNRQVTAPVVGLRADELGIGVMTSLVVRVALAGEALLGRRRHRSSSGRRNRVSLPGQVVVSSDRVGSDPTRAWQSCQVTSQIRIEQRAELVAYAAEETDDFDPAALTELLGISPTTAYMKGDVLKSGRVHPFSSWVWQTVERVEHDSELLVQEILDIFEPAAGQLAEAGARWSLEFQVGLVISMYGSIEQDPDGTPGAVVSTPALFLSPATLRRLSALNCALDVDGYVIAPE